MKWISLLNFFLPWVMYALLSSYSKPLAIGLSLLIALASYKRLTKGFFMEWTTLLIFSLSFVLIVLLKNKWYENYESIFTTASFGLITWLSLFLKRPFTAQYAKERVEECYWNSPLFLRINTLMTLSFGLLFSLVAALKVVLLYFPDLFSPTLIWVLVIPFQLLLIRWFPDWYQKRALRPGKLHEDN